MDTTRIVRFEDECVLIPEYDRSSSKNGGGGGAFGFKKLMIPLFKPKPDSFIHKARSPTSPSLASPLPSCLVHRDTSTPTGRKVQRRPSLPLPVKVISSSTSPNLPSLSPSLSKSPSTSPNPNPFTLPTTIPLRSCCPDCFPATEKAESSLIESSVESFYSHCVFHALFFSYWWSLLELFLIPHASGRNVIPTLDWN
ncbi:hypothetical protein D9758_018560 [Tetrapyrgos nigripes]|uniref:Uncharacterized protein n=1 Tax=Tetrapyrgos nigripes TaxID=182062 RepID=A0A8H5BT11_9AGAR|nr:hypothetical protein D9758_018560 [Tetrapyrgos nigripes]